MYKKYEPKVRKWVKRKAVGVILRRMLFVLLPTEEAKKVKFKLNVGGGSYTDGKSLVVGIPEYFWEMSYEEIFIAAKALLVHEAEHILSSDFEIFKQFQIRVSREFDRLLTNTTKNATSQYSAHAQYGRKLGAHLLNSTEDGRIEKRSGQRRRGFVKYLKFLNAVIWKKQPVRGDNPATEFLYCITSICVTGLKTKEWDTLYAGTPQDVVLDEIRPIIIQAINEPTAQGCADRTYEIYEIIAPVLADMVKDDLDAMQDMMDNADFSDTSAPEDGEISEGGGGGISTHFTPEVPQPNEEDDSNEENDEEEEDKDNKSSGSASKDSDDEKDKKDKKDESEEDSEDGSGGSESDDDTEDESKSQSKGTGKESDKESDEESQDGSSSSSSQDDEADEDSDKDATDGSTGKGDDEEDSDDEASQGDDEDNSKVEEDLVNQFMNQETDNLLDDVSDDLESIDEEEKRIEKEEEKRKKESGNLKNSEIKDVLQGSNAHSFLQRGLNDPTTAEPAPAEIQQKGKSLRKKLEKVLLNKTTPTRKHQKRGYLDRNNLYKVGMRDFEVFEKRGTPDKSTYAIQVLVDRSGSMEERVSPGRTKMDCAIEAVSIIEESLKGLVPLRINFFHAGWNDVIHETVLDFGDKERHLNYSYSQSRQAAQNGNMDSVSIRLATKEIMKRNETKKILIVLSDGLPSAYNTEEEALSSVQSAVRDARKEGVQVIAICFGNKFHLERTEEKYRQMYQKGIIMVESENIPEHLAKVMEREIR